MADPISILADGNVKVAWVPAIAGAAPTVAELIAGTVVDLSCYLTADGFRPSTEEATVTDDRLCSRQTYESRGRFTDSLEFMYIYQAQNGTPADNKAFNTLVAGTLGFVVVRWGLAYETAFAAAQKVDVYPAECGIQRKQTPEQNSKLKVMQKIFIRNGVTRDVAVAA